MFKTVYMPSGIKRSIYVGSSASAPKRRKLWLRRSRLASIGSMAAIRRGSYSSRIYSFKRVAEATSLAVGTSGAIEFRLNELPNNTEFINLFDRYRIVGVSVRIVPIITAYDGNPSATALARPNVHTAVDLNDSTAPANVQELMQYDTYKMTPGDRTHQRYLKPRVSQEIFRTAITTNYGMGAASQWLDCTANGADLPHFCLKYFIDSIGHSYSFRVYKTFFLEFQGTR